MRSWKVGWGGKLSKRLNEFRIKLGLYGALDDEVKCESTRQLILESEKELGTTLPFEVARNILWGKQLENKHDF